MAPPRTIPEKVARQAQALWDSPRIVVWRTTIARWQKTPYSGTLILVIGTILVTLLSLAIYNLSSFTNIGLIYLPLVAFLAYHWNWRYAAIGTILQLICVYILFIPPIGAIKSLDEQGAVKVLTLAAVTAFVLALVQLARQRRAAAEQEAARFAALNHIGMALASELDEPRLLHLIAETTRDLTGATFAAFTLRPVNEWGEPTVPSEGHLFYLAAVVGVTEEQEEWFKHVPLGGEGLLAPIFRQGVPVRVPDALAFIHTETSGAYPGESREAARHAAFAYAHGLIEKEGLQSLGVPRGHPIIRSFLGAPLLDRDGEVRGGFLLGHTEPDKFTEEHESLLVGLAAQAAIALENARLYHAAEEQAQELNAIFESIADGVIVVDQQGEVVRENAAAKRIRILLQNTPETAVLLDQLLNRPAALALQGTMQHSMPNEPISIIDARQETRELTVSAFPLHKPQQGRSSGSLQQKRRGSKSILESTVGAVLVWHDITEARRLQREQQAHAETEARRALLQIVMEELPSSVYLVRGRDARLVLANRATASVWGAVWSEGQPMAEFLSENGIRVLHFDGRPFSADEYATIRAVQNGEMIRQHQEIIRHPDGTSLPVLVNAVALQPGSLDWSSIDGNQLCPDEQEPAAIVVHQDVTALKEAEHLKDEFISIAAHELRTPMAVLKGFSRMLILQTDRGNGAALDDWQREAIEDIDQATTRLAELTDDLLDVTRLQGGRLALQLEPADLVALVRRVVARLQVTTDRHPITITGGEEPIIVTVDQPRIEQVFTNIINNAIKYSPEGGPIDITMRVFQQARIAQISVRDHGIGIPRDQQSRIFGRFMRADNAQAYGIRGTGLGLYLSRELVERHNGRTWFESIEGDGTIFYVTLPLA